MGIAERREREREELRMRIVEAARDLVSGEGLEGLSMRAIAERIEYSPATIYLYFRDKEELVREVVRAGFEGLAEYSRSAVEALDSGADAAERFAALGRAYARFALENTAYFRVMFELPGVAQVVDCDPPRAEGDTDIGAGVFEGVVAVVEEAAREGLFRTPDPFRTALVGWGMIHGLTSLYLSGHLTDGVADADDFLTLVEEAIQSFGLGLRAFAGGSGAES